MGPAKTYDVDEFFFRGRLNNAGRHRMKKKILEAGWYIPQVVAVYRSVRFEGEDPAFRNAFPELTYLSRRNAFQQSGSRFRISTRFLLGSKQQVLKGKSKIGVRSD